MKERGRSEMPLTSQGKSEKTEGTLFALGRQLTIEYHRCGPEKLLSQDYLEQVFLKAAEESGATIVSSSFNTFQPQGVSGVVVIAESHFTVHAWPEHDYAAVDIFTCGDSIDLDKAVNSLKESLASEEVVISADMNRGIISNRAASGGALDTQAGSGVYPISWKRDYENKNPWGVLSSVDVYGCDSGMVRDGEALRRFAHELCELLRMKPNGGCRVTSLEEGHETRGLSMSQPTESGLISCHVDLESNAVYLDLFSHRFYEPRDVAEFAIKHLKGRHYKLQIAMRQ
jgi:S-adenosylmethionine decarboxylase